LNCLFGDEIYFNLLEGLQGLKDKNFLLAKFPQVYEHYAEPTYSPSSSDSRTSILPAGPRHHSDDWKNKGSPMDRTGENIDLRHSCLPTGKQFYDVLITLPDA